MGCRYRPWVLFTFCLVLALAGCAIALSPTKPSSASSSIVAVGDSVPAGSACNCVPYPELTASSLTQEDSHVVTAMNDAVGGYTSEDVLGQVRADPDVISHLENATVVEIEVGANDVAYTDSCGTSVACYSGRIPTVEHNLTAIVARVHELTHSHAVLVVLLDYWSVWLGGQYAEAQGPAYVDAAITVTDRLNAAIKQTAVDSGSAYVDLRAAFKGPDYAYDETQYLASDGDHPNAAGHRQIADAAVSVITDTLHR